MKRLLGCFAMLICAALPTSAYAQEPAAVTKTACMSALGFDDEATLKNALLADAKRLVVNELFGELISASTTVENMAVTRDQIRASSMGFLRTQGDPLYFNGEDFAEVCVTLAGYVTAEDLALFEPVPLSHRLCASDPAQSAAELRDATRAEAVAQALNQYEPRLLARDRAQVLLLMKRVSYAGSGFLPDSDIFCAEVAGEVVPVEVLTFVSALDEDVQATAVAAAVPDVTMAPTTQVTATPTPSSALDLARTPNATATAAAATAQAFLARTPTPMPTAMPMPTVSPTPDATATVIFALSQAVVSVDQVGLTDLAVADDGVLTAVNPQDGATYVFVPGGQFSIGSVESSGSVNEHPRHAVTLGAYWIMQTEVTNAQYAACVHAGVCSAAVSSRWKDKFYAQHPVTGVDWAKAAAYATWAGGRLPTEAEWEAACRGNDGRTYPWGDELPTAGRSNFFSSNIGGTKKVGSYPAGASPYGVLDMAGNVWEWTNSLYEQYPYDAADGREDLEAQGTRVLRGGSFNLGAGGVRCAVRTSGIPGHGGDGYGFRVVYPEP